ncbi:hypothetical protein [Kitasatospora sp. NPDC093679]|uniref:hypothetical protein n=1 Tax=Kitasatospora sp. NPDC093679 TaxID=3154983 RepID=UPI0034200279
MYRPVSRRPAEIAFGVVSGLLLLGGTTVTAGSSFVMLFVPDGCGSSPVSGRRVCDGTGYLEVVAAPRVSLVAAVLPAGPGSARARRRGRTPWPALFPAVLVHPAGLGFVHTSVRGQAAPGPMPMPNPFSGTAPLMHVRRNVGEDREVAVIIGIAAVAALVVLCTCMLVLRRRRNGRG